MCGRMFSHKRVGNTLKLRVCVLGIQEEAKANPESKNPGRLISRIHKGVIILSKRKPEISSRNDISASPDQFHSYLEPKLSALLNSSIL